MFNIAQYLPQRARLSPAQAAVICEHAPDELGRTALTFAELNNDSDMLARGLYHTGLTPGARTLVMLRPGLDFISMAFALFKLGAVPVLIDPGMGRKNLFDCINQVRPEAMIAVPLAHAARVLTGHEAFEAVRLNVTVGRRWFWGGLNLSHLRRLGYSDKPFKLEPTTEDSPAAILFTTGSTGVPKGVLYTHGMFGAQVDAIRAEYQIEPGEVDLPAFPLFALFSTALGTTCVIPDMDPTRPAQCDPAKIVAAIQKHNVTYTFGSPSIWKRVGPYCVENKISLPTVKRVLMAGAPVRAEVLSPMQQVLPNGDTFIPYGATESLPVATIRGSEVLRDTWALTRAGKGYCVGRPLGGMAVAIYKCGTTSTRRHGDTEVGEQFDPERVLPAGEIGEIVVSGPVVTREYYNLPDQTRAAKLYERFPSPLEGEGRRERTGRGTAAERGVRGDVPHSPVVWHRMGDMGYFDDQGRLWFCGRKAHRVLKRDETLYSVCVEAQFEAALAEIQKTKLRAALVGIGAPGDQSAVVLIETGRLTRDAAIPELPEFKAWMNSSPLRGSIDFVTEFRGDFPVDIRHNAKINREELARWAEKQLAAKLAPQHTHADDAH